MLVDLYTLNQRMNIFMTERDTATIQSVLCGKKSAAVQRSECSACSGVL